jgi:hypothetical protein
MKRIFLFSAALGVMAAIAALALQPQARSFPSLEWAKEAKVGKPTSAIVVEFGLKDVNVRDWSGTAAVSGAKVVHREGYRFRSEDKLVGENGWETSSHRGLRVPKGQPAIAKLEPIATVGVVLHLQDVANDAKLTITLRDGEKAEVSLNDVLAGRAQTLWNGAAALRLITTATPIADGLTEDDFPAAAYGPDGTLWVAYVAYHVLEDDRRIEPKQLKEQPADFKKYYTPEGRDQVMLRAFKNGKWEEPIELTDAKQSVERVAVGATGSGGVWVVYSALRNGAHGIYARPLEARGRFGSEQQLHQDAGSHLSPKMCTDANGTPWLAWQSWNEKGETFLNKAYFSDGRWNHWTRLVWNAGNTMWHPTIAASSSGQVAIAYELFNNGNYDISVYNGILDGFPAAGWKILPREYIAATPKFEARPSAQYDKAGRLWIAYEEGPEQWGKDYGTLVMNKGKPLYNKRNVRVVCMEPDGKLNRPVAELPVSHYDPPKAGDAAMTNQYERTTRYAYPQIGLDANGNVWLAYRQNFGSRYTTHPGGYWLNFVRRLEGDHWSEPIEVHHSDGLLDSRPVLLPHASGGLLIINNTDGRYTTPEIINNQIYSSVVNLPGTPAPPKLVGHSAGNNSPTPEVKAENEAVERMRRGKVHVGGKTYQYKRGEYHRHTEISWDGSADGSLEDMFRYAIDAVKFDWIGNGDHDNGAGREYSWWLIQKFTDAYATRQFTPMFTYERSVAYPHGHRNVMFAQRGIRTLPRLAAPPGEKKKAEGAVHPDDTKMLYRYLKEFGGICAVHTSATSMGTDWRDNDPVVEPIVEIYQGDRMSYEKEGAPRAGYDPKGGKEPANVAGWFPKGFVNLALKDKGYKLGFQASSDHWSTHISFFTVLVEAGNRTSVAEDRQALLDAIKKRHCYGATDNILVDFRCGDAIMGDETETKGPPTFSVHVHGAGALEKVEMLRDSEVVDSLLPKVFKDASHKVTWTDPQPLEGTHYYYVRVLQTDGEIAWASPIWVTKK